MNYIYGLHEAGSGEVRYVGKTCQLSVRLKEHERADYRYWNRLFSEWIGAVKASGTLCARVLEEAPVDWRIAEIAWIRRLRRERHRLLNSHPGGNAPTNGAFLSEEHRARIAAANLGKKMGPPGAETRARIGAGNLGKKRSPEARAKISAGVKGSYARCPERRAKISAAMKGRALLLETRAKISAAHKGMVPSLEARAKMSEARKGKKTGPLSQETRARISEALKGKKRGLLGVQRQEGK